MSWFWRLIQDSVKLPILCAKGRPHLSPTTSQDGGMSNSSLIGICLLKCLYAPCSVANNYFLPKPEFPSSFFFLILFIPLGFLLPVLSFLYLFPLRFCSCQNSTTMAKRFIRESYPGVVQFTFSTEYSQVKRYLGI